MCRDLLAVESPIFDENFIGSRTRNDHPGHINPRHIALEGYGITNWTALVSRELDSRGSQEFIIGVVSRQGKHKIVLDCHFAFRRVQPDVIGRNLLHRTVEIGSDLPVLDAVLNIRKDPVLHMRVHLGTAMYQRYPRSMPP